MKTVTTALWAMALSLSLAACDSDKPSVTDLGVDSSTPRDAAAESQDVDGATTDGPAGSDAADASDASDATISVDTTPTTDTTPNTDATGTEDATAADQSVDAAADLGANSTPDADTNTYFAAADLVGAWKAYNDCVAGVGNAANVTAYHFEGTASGLLKRFSDGVDTAVTVTMTSSSVSSWDPPGVTFDQGTDARAVFGGIVDLSEVATYNDGSVDGHYTATFSGLDPKKTYAVVTTANRQQASYGIGGASPRWTRFELIGADSALNISSKGALRESDGSVLINTGFNQERGHVAAWTKISTASGSFALVSRNVGSSGPGDARKFYGLQGLMLMELAPAL